ncbi:hypothetical protein [Brevibacillus thermoruber]|uniref:hypothetical protein n=1 Tax=Brevibacillus thermoruber TaxID=33942 RepID=UPI000554E953|nr:hypothetical protein [Brevibacillus thermoruber]
MVYVSKLLIRTSWKVGEREIEWELESGHRREQILVAENIANECSYQTQRDEWNPINTGSPTAITAKQTKDGKLLHFEWKCPYNLTFANTNRRRCFLSKLNENIRLLCSYGVIRGHFPMKDTIAQLLELEINHAYTLVAGQDGDKLVSPVTGRNYFSWFEPVDRQKWGILSTFSLS